MEFTEYDTRLASYAVVVDDRDRILLALFNQGPTPAWTLPGGGVELHESVEQAAVRELREETGYAVELGRLLGCRWWPALCACSPREADRFGARRTCSQRPLGRTHAERVG